MVVFDKLEDAFMVLACLLLISSGNKSLNDSDLSLEMAHEHSITLHIAYEESRHVG